MAKMRIKTFRRNSRRKRNTRRKIRGGVFNANPSHTYEETIQQNDGDTHKKNLKDRLYQCGNRYECEKDARKYIYDNVKGPEEYIQALLYHCWTILYYTPYNSWDSNRPKWLIPLQKKYAAKNGWLGSFQKWHDEQMVQMREAREKRQERRHDLARDVLSANNGGNM